MKPRRVAARLTAEGDARERDERARVLLDHPERYPGMVELDRDGVAVRIWEYRALGSFTTWALLRDVGAARFVVRRVEWDRAMDARHSLPDPTTYGADHELGEHAALELMRELESLDFRPFVSARGLGLDGVTYGVSFGPRRHSTRVSWWCDAPAEWLSLEAWYRRAQEVFEAVLPPSRCANRGAR